MPKLKPIAWRELVKRLRVFGFDGPYQSGKHPYMAKDDLTLTVPNPYKEDISVDLLARILRQAGIDRKEWVSKD